MTTLGKKISDARKAKGLTQEALSEMLKVNLRTVQRIENSETMPRGSTLNHIGEALGLKPAELQIQDEGQKKPWSELLVGHLFLVPLNIVLMIVPGYLCLHLDANTNSRVGALLLGFFIPWFLVSKTQQTAAVERLVKYGAGYMAYLLIALVQIGFIRSIGTFLLPVLLISLAVLYYGDRVMRDA